ncbi:hypothetical protein [Halothiobacillus sp.]|uniref:hypothetical protein n=1 Tax=Halothiobacillus sp. TaxID=1891311 RepID=UPI002AD3B34A|nr:hypothetical protein [Halothiobacillus sp.]
MNKTTEIWNITVEAVLRFLRRPFSNFVTRILLFSGAAVFISPPIEDLIFNAVLRDWLGIDLGIEVPGTEAYAFGTALMLIGAIHNIVFVYLMSAHDLAQKKTKNLVYKEMWIRIDTLVDDIARLGNLYLTVYADRDDEMVTKAESSYLNYVTFLRENRPFFFSEKLYKYGMDLAELSVLEMRAFRACISEKNKPNSSWDFNLAQKTANVQIELILNKYDVLCQEIRQIQLGI